MNAPKHVDTLFLFEAGSVNTIINDNHGQISTNGAEHHPNAMSAPKSKEATGEAASLIDSLLAYLKPLESHANPQLTSPAAEVLTLLFNNPKVFAWISVSKDQTVCFNRGKVFKLVRMLRAQHFYLDRFTDWDLNKLLEQKSADTNFRKNMNKASQMDSVIEDIVKELIKPLIKIA